MVCAQCHSFRDIYVNGFQAGANYYDYFLPVMEYRLPASDNAAYWADGRPRWFGNEAFGLWQSACFLKGHVTCVICHSNDHDVNFDRSLRLRSDTNALCAKCHTEIARNVSAHTHHAPTSTGSSCVECHMPTTVISIKARMRDHSMSIPAPENTMRHGIPNACNLCHKEKGLEWARLQMNKWYGENAGQKFIRRADAFTQARDGDPAAIPLLLKILSDDSEAQLLRANAAGYLGSFPNDPSAYDALVRSLSDPEPLLRSTSALAIRPRAAQRETIAPQIVSLLADGAATARMSAVIALVAMGVRRPPGQDGERFDRAAQLYRARAELDSDDAQQQFAAGKFFLLVGDVDGAASVFRATLKLDDTIPAQYYLARALVEKGELASAQEILEKIPQNDSQYGAARRLLAEIESRGAGHVGLQPNEASQAEPQPKIGAGENAAGPETGGAAPNTPNAQSHALFLDAQLSYENGRYGVALKPLEQALELAPDAPWALKAKIYRAVCLEKLGNRSDAEAAMQALSREPGVGNDVDLQLAYVELLYDTGRFDDALKRVDTLIAAVPNLPLAYFWRAKALLQLHRTAEAATAAEESVRLLPDAPLGHNLVLRIYQMQGRTKEAAEQAEWLRDYERRVQSH